MFCVLSRLSVNRPVAALLKGMLPKPASHIGGPINGSDVNVNGFRSACIGRSCRLLRLVDLRIALGEPKPKMSTPAKGMTKNQGLAASERRSQLMAVPLPPGGAL